jgi:hypothetical protein
MQQAHSPNRSHERWVPVGQAQLPLTQGIPSQQSHEFVHAPSCPLQQVDKALEPHTPPSPR